MSTAIVLSDDEEHLEPNENGNLFSKARLVPYLGIVMALTSGLMFTLDSLIVDLMPDVNAVVIVVIRSYIQLIIYCPATLVNGNGLQVASGEKLYLLLRTFFGFGAFTLSYYGLKNMALGDTMTIVFSAPVFISIFACILLNEPCGTFQVVSLMITISGVVLVARPTVIFGPPPQNSAFEPGQSLIGAAYSLAACLCVSLAFITIRRLQRTSTFVVIACFSFVSILLGTALILVQLYVFNMVVGLPTSLKDIACCIACGLCGVIGQFFMTWSLKIEEAGLVSLVRTFDIVLAFIFQATFLKQRVFTTSILGGFLVFTCVCMCCVKKLYSSRPDMFERRLNCIKNTLSCCRNELQ